MDRVLNFLLLLIFFNLNTYSQNLNSIVPSSANPGETLSVTISGSNISYFDQYSSLTAASIRFTQLSGTTFYGSYQNHSGSNLYANVTIPQNAPLGPYNLQVQDAISYNWFTLNNAFNIVPLDTTPRLTSIAANYGYQGQDSLSVSISGQYCDFGNQFSGISPFRFSQFSGTTNIFTGISTSSIPAGANFNIPVPYDPNCSYSNTFPLNITISGPVLSNYYMNIYI